MLLADTQQCSIKVLEDEIGTDSIQFTLNSSEAGCRFRVNSVDKPENSTVCDQDQEIMGLVKCRLVNLDPGTWYHLTITSETDSNQHNISLPTSK